MNGQKSQLLPVREYEVIEIKPILYFQENFLFIQKVEEQPSDCDVSHSMNKWLPHGWDKIAYSGEEKFGSVVPPDNTIGQVNGKWIHADHNEKSCPFLIFPYINNQIKYSQEQHTQTTNPTNE